MIGGCDLLTVDVASTRDDVATSHPDVFDRRQPGEDPRVQDAVASGFGQLTHVERNDIGWFAGGDRRAGSAKRLAASETCGVEEGPARRSRSAREHVALPLPQTLRVFELPQFCRDSDQDIGIGADAIPTTVRDKILAWEDAIAQICLGDRTETGDGTTFRQSPRLIEVEVRGVDQAPARRLCGARPNTAPPMFLTISAQRSARRAKASTFVMKRR